MEMDNALLLTHFANNLTPWEAALNATQAISLIIETA
jgi:hypothetical protein